MLIKSLESDTVDILPMYLHPLVAIFTSVFFDEMVLS